MNGTLDAYLKSKGLPEADFAARIGRDRSVVNKLRRGVIRPSLDLAAAIERETDGEVPMQAWTAPHPSQQAAA